MTGGNPICRGFHATPHPDNTPIDGVRFTHPILQSVASYWWANWHYGATVSGKKMWDMLRAEPGNQPYNFHSKSRVQIKSGPFHGVPGVVPISGP